MLKALLGLALVSLVTRKGRQLRLCQLMSLLLERLVVLLTVTKI